MTVSEFEVVEVVNAVWQSMLGMECYDMGPEAALDEGPFITATVLITGAYEGGVTLQLSSSVGRNLAALMFGMETDEVSADECIDAVGELANMVGGNLKALVPQPAKLSLPSVAEGDSYKVSFPGTEIISQVAVGFEGHILRVEVHSRTDAQSNKNSDTHRSVA
ncbi:MAG: chemotaxis protein CheX [Acidimicrobiales bacterium]|nr:chemotaxis protein CheX [Acidimicrobiales bacterium]